jgi:hypothetical protein
MDEVFRGENCGAQIFSLSSSVAESEVIRLWSRKHSRVDNSWGEAL